MTNRAKHIIQYAETVETFTATQYVTTLNADVSLHSIVNILNRMVRQGRLQRLKRGVYALARHNMWKVVLGDMEKTVYNFIHSQFPLIRICVYNGETFAPLQHHLAFNQATYIEVERDSVESVFYRLQDAGYEAYRTPNQQMAYDYVDVKKKIVIVKPLVTQAPLMKQDKYYVPMLEKLLVDIRADKDFFYMQGIEATYMTETARQMYMLNEEKLQRYAKRRNVKI
jgi:hypothetical protein